MKSQDGNDDGTDKILGISKGKSLDFWRIDGIIRFVKKEKNWDSPIFLFTL
jgi:hypothetical protein